MSRDEFETDLSGEIEEERQFRHEHICAMRDIEQGIAPVDTEEDEA